MSHKSPLSQSFNQYKNQTISRLGKKIEVILRMIAESEDKLNRYSNIINKCKLKYRSSKSIWIKRKYLKIQKRVLKKYHKEKQTLIKLEEMRKQKVDDYKINRESIGLHDHEVVDKLYGESD